MTQNLKVMTSHVSSVTPSGVYDHFLSYFIERLEKAFVGGLGTGGMGGVLYGRGMGNVLARQQP